MNKFVYLMTLRCRHMVWIPRSVDQSRVEPNILVLNTSQQSETKQGKEGFLEGYWAK